MVATPKPKPKPKTLSPEARAELATRVLDAALEAVMEKLQSDDIIRASLVGQASTLLQHYERFHRDKDVKEVEKVKYAEEIKDLPTVFAEDQHHDPVLSVPQPDPDEQVAASVRAVRSALKTTCDGEC